MNTEQAWEILGVPAGSSPKDVQLAYRQKALEVHPDRASSESEAVYFTKCFLKVRDAYEHLRAEGFPIPEPQTVVQDPPRMRTVHRRFSPREGEEPSVGLAEKLGVEFQISNESIVIWVLLIPGGIVFLVYFLRFLFCALRS